MYIRLYLRMYICICKTIISMYLCFYVSMYLCVYTYIYIYRYLVGLLAALLFHLLLLRLYSLHLRLHALLRQYLYFCMYCRTGKASKLSTASSAVCWRNDGATTSSVIACVRGLGGSLARALSSSIRFCAASCAICLATLGEFIAASSRPFVVEPTSFSRASISSLLLDLPSSCAHTHIAFASRNHSDSTGLICS